MGDVSDLAVSSAIEKMREIADDEIAMRRTFVADGAETRPMATQGIDDDGTFWFFSHRASAKNRQIAATPRAQLVYATKGGPAFLSVVGPAVVSREPREIDELWTRFAKAWFPDGKDDPSLTLISVLPTEAHYWDSTHGRMVQMAGILVSDALGKPLDDGREGSLTTPTETRTGRR